MSRHPSLGLVRCHISRGFGANNDYGQLVPADTNIPEKPFQSEISTTEPGADTKNFTDRCSIMFYELGSSGERSHRYIHAHVKTQPLQCFGDNKRKDWEFSSIIYHPKKLSRRW